MTHEIPKKRPKAILLSIRLPKVSEAANNDSLAELSRLVTTLGFDILTTITQPRSGISGISVIGQGKLKELAKFTGGTGIVKSAAPQRKHKAAEKFESNQEEELIEEQDFEDEEAYFEDSDNSLTEKADVVIFDGELTPSQLANLQSAVGVEVLDRTGVIVEIFSRHAKTRESRLQVEIARLNYLAPRVRETGAGSGDRIAGKAGETKLELDRRKIRDRVSELKQELINIQKEQSVRRKSRSDQPCVALVGYTNAGKSSLMRALTGSEVLVEDKLFATLDTTVRALYPESKPKILISDTVGFIKKLPHDLVASFRSTLDEAANASLLLFVVDASDPSFRSQLEVTKQVLSEIGITDIPQKIVLNKVDKLDDNILKNLLIEFPGAIAISTLNRNDIINITEKIINFFEQEMVEKEIFVPFTTQGAIGELRKNVRVLEEQYDENGTYLKIRTPENYLNRLKTEFNIE